MFKLCVTTLSKNSSVTRVQNPFLAQIISWKSTTKFHEVQEEPGVAIIKGLPQAWLETDIQSHFSQGNFQVQRVNLIKNRAGEKTGKALLTFGNKSQAESFIQKWNNRQLTLDNYTQQIAAQLFSVQRSGESAESSQVAEVKRVYIYNLSWKCDHEDLHKLGSEFGKVSDIDFPLTANNKNKGFAYITFDDAKDANRFVQSNNEKSFQGRKIKVNLSKSKFENEAKGSTPFTNVTPAQKKTEYENDKLTNNVHLYQQLLKNRENGIGSGNKLRMFFTDTRREFEY